MPLDDDDGGFPLAPQLLVQPLLRLPHVAVQRPPPGLLLLARAPLLLTSGGAKEGVVVAAGVQAQ